MDTLVISDYSKMKRLLGVIGQRMFVEGIGTGGVFTRSAQQLIVQAINILVIYIPSM